MIGLDAWIFTRCGDCDKPKILAVESNRLIETRGCIHFAVPAARWWDDVGFT